MCVSGFFSRVIVVHYQTLIALFVASQLLIYDEEAQRALCHRRALGLDNSGWLEPTLPVLRP